MDQWKERERETRILRNIYCLTFKLNLGEALTLDLILDRKFMWQTRCSISHLPETQTDRQTDSSSSLTG